MNLSINVQQLIARYKGEGGRMGEGSGIREHLVLFMSVLGNLRKPLNLFGSWLLTHNAG